MFVELDGENDGDTIFVNIDQVSSAFLSANGNVLTISFAPGDQHTLRGEANIKTLLAALRAAERSR